MVPRAAISWQMLMGHTALRHPLPQVSPQSHKEEGSALDFLYQPVAKACWLRELLKYRFRKLQ